MLRKASSLNGSIDGKHVLQKRVWLAFGLLLFMPARGLGLHNLDYDSAHYGSLKKYTVPSGDAAGYSVLDVTPDGTVVVGSPR